MYCVQILTVMRLGRELLARNELTGHLRGDFEGYWRSLVVKFQQCVKKFDVEVLDNKLV